MCRNPFIFPNFAHARKMGEGAHSSLSTISPIMVTAKRGIMNERGNAFSAASINSMLARG
jgi:hypothetical protein